MSWEQPKVYAVQHMDEDIREKSRSGGFFTALSDKVLELGGVVYGCVLTKDFKAIHIRVESKSDRDQMRGSKYIQSSMGNIYKSVKDDLNEHRKVLFSGTSCQIAGLKSFLGQDYDNLFCLDIVCHGVPSPKVWKEYLLWQEKRKNSRIVNVDFRNKKDYGWRAHVETLYLENGETIDSKVFTLLFYSHNILRPSCYECPFKSIMHPGDITIADYWGIEKAAPEFDDNKGVSLVLVNNERGMLWFESIKDWLRWKQTKLEDSMQGPLIAPCSVPENRNKFWTDFSKKKFNYIAEEYGGLQSNNIIRRINKKIKRKLSRQ